MGDPAMHSETPQASRAQYGEDLIVKGFCDKIGIERGTVVEFGAGDGTHLSNAHGLVTKHSWDALLIESDPKRFAELRRKFQPFSQVTCLQRMVTLESPSTLDEILRENGVPQDFDFLSIDVDGVDYHIWKSLSLFNPKFVLIEYNPSFPNHIRYVQEPDMRVTKGASPLALVELGKMKGYELIATSRVNCLFARADFVAQLGIRDNNLEGLRHDYTYVSWLVQFFDGTTAIYGSRQLPWHGVSIREKDIQVLPAFLRVYPPRAGRLRRHGLRMWRWFRRRADQLSKRHQSPK